MVFVVTGFLCLTISSILAIHCPDMEFWVSGSSSLTLCLAKFFSSESQLWLLILTSLKNLSLFLICFALETFNLCLLLCHGNDVPGTVDVL